MKRSYKKAIAWALSTVMIVMSGCSTSNTQTENTNQAEKELAVGDIVNGFTVKSISENDTLQSNIIGFTHEKSGANLVWVKNSDPELTFSISYHTPYIDETDTNHIFEHAILASSEKYPSKDLFFDLVGKSYNTFINAFTYNTFTTYPLASESEEQFIKLIDAYLSCMVAPEVMENENIFKREAIRYELDSPEDEINMIGTVYSEDFGFLTETFNEALNNMEDALYPGQYASNAIGRSHRNYQNLTYQAVKDTYNRYYHFDNSLIFLYGDMDYNKVLGFIDEQYLSKAEKAGVDLSIYKDPITENGYVEKTVFVPAYEDDQTQNASTIDYGFSLEDKSWEDIISWLVLSTALNHENSALHTNLKAQGIQNQVEVYTETYNAKPYILFRLLYGEEEQNQAFKAVVDKTLADIAENGIDKTILNAVLKQTKTSNYLLRDQENVGIEIFPNIVNYWTHTGNYDFYDVFENTMDSLEKDTEQQTIRRLAKEMQNARRSALISNVPQAGLAETIIAQRDTYLADMKTSMTDEQIQQMIQDTKDFREWNELELSNDNFTIDPVEIADQQLYTNYKKTEGDGVTYYMAPAEIENVGKYRIYFDISDFSDEERMDLGLYNMLIGMMGTKEHNLEEILNLQGEYLNNYNIRFLYADGEDAYPIMRLNWISLTEDYETGLQLLLDMLGNTDFTDTKRIKQLLARDIDNYDLSRAGDKFDTAYALALAYHYNEYAYEEKYRGQNLYYYLKEVQNKLEQDSSYGAALAQRLQSVSDKIMKKGRMIFACAAPENDIETIQKTSAALLEALPAKEIVQNTIELPKAAQKRAVAVESSQQYAFAVGNIFDVKEFTGKYIPFIMAANNEYIIPKIRFQMGAYSANTHFDMNLGVMAIYSYSDPNVSKTIKVFESTPDFIETMELTQEDLNGYILSAISTVNASFAKGMLSKPLSAIENEILGRDSQKIYDVVNSVKHASLEDQQQATECVKKILEQSGFATTGNEAKLKAEQDAFDQVLSYKTENVQ